MNNFGFEISKRNSVNWEVVGQVYFGLYQALQRLMIYSFYIKIIWLICLYNPVNCFACVQSIYCNYSSLVIILICADANSVLQPIREKDIPQIKMADADEMNVVMEEVFSKTKASSGLSGTPIRSLKKCPSQKSEKNLEYQSSQSGLFTKHQ